MKEILVRETNSPGPSIRHSDPIRFCKIQSDSYGIRSDAIGFYKIPWNPIGIYRKSGVGKLTEP